MPKREVVYQFTVDINGKQYQCDRRVTGTRVLYQSVCVHGVGSKDDSSKYEAKDPRSLSMATTAEIIAGDIIRSFLNQRQ